MNFKMTKLLVLTTSCQVKIYLFIIPSFLLNTYIHIKVNIFRTFIKSVDFNNSNFQYQNKRFIYVYYILQKKKEGRNESKITKKFTKTKEQKFSLKSKLSQLIKVLLDGCRRCLFTNQQPFLQRNRRTGSRAARPQVVTVEASSDAGN